MFSEVTEKHLREVFSRYFCPETELLYDFVVDENGNAWHHLPTPDKIATSVPNPCGWGTGMEDSAMNGGNAIDALLTAYDVTHDARIKPLVDALFRGLLRCASVEMDDGFVARSISPFDGKSHYIETSRDQYTHWIYAALHLYDSELCDAEQRVQIRDGLVRIARKCEREVIPEKGYHMLRADGTVGRVGKMWEELGTHEWLRLPMFYLAAYCVTDDPHWQKLYLKYRDEALECSLPHEPDTMRCYASLQMQCSLRLILDHDTDADETFRTKLRGLMKRCAAYGEKNALLNSAEYCTGTHDEAIYYRFRAWDKVDHMRQEGVINGYNYNNPAQSERKDVNGAFYPVREIAEGAMMAAMCPDHTVTPELLAAVDRMAEKLDLKRFSSIYAPLLLSCAHILCRERMLNG